MVVALLLLLAAGGVLLACLQRAKEQHWHAPGLALPRRRLPARPAEDLPPPNLPPLVPSQRALVREYERGLRELTLFLARPAD